MERRKKSLEKALKIISLKEGLVTEFMFDIGML